MIRHIFMTGMTGSIGSWIARQFLEQGHRVTALVRGKDGTEAVGKVARTLEIVEASDFAERVTVLRGDICEAGLGLTDDIPQGVDCVVHCAALMDFAEDAAVQLEQVNIEGTSHVLDWAEEQGLPVAYISTAYIAGQRRSRVYEHDIDQGQSFNNPYESSKCRAELVLRDWAARTGLSTTVLRPGIVLGDWRKGRIVNFDGFYHMLRFFDAIAQSLGQDDFRVQGNPRATKNLVPVDYVARAVYAILQSSRPGTYHLTLSKPIQLAELQDIFRQLFNLVGGRLVGPEDFERIAPTRLESLYRKAAGYYEPYLRAEPAFDRTQTDRILSTDDMPEPTIDSAFVKRLLVYARSAQWGKRCAPTQDRSQMSHDSVNRYFDVFLVDKKHRPLLPNLTRLNATCRIVLEDIPGKTWTLGIEQGCLERISYNGMDCQCTYTVNRQTFDAIVSGRLAPQKAFFQRKVEIDGDMETGLRLATVLADFFRQWPYQG
jgi:2-alkyl-3-oxoalkanoate reductase